MSHNSIIPCAVLTVSDRGAAGETEDRSGPLLVRMLEEQLAGAQVVRTAIVADDIEGIQAFIREWADEQQVRLILTTGGTGFAPRDQTPEAVRPLLEREAPGLVVAMLSASLKITPYAMLSRPVAGMRGQTLIVTLPGSPKGATENLQTILPALPHGLGLLSQVKEESKQVAHQKANIS